MSPAVVEKWSIKAGDDAGRHVISVETVIGGRPSGGRSIFGVPARHPACCSHRWRLTSAETDPAMWMCDGVKVMPGKYEICVGCGAVCGRDKQGRIEIYDVYPVPAEGGAGGKTAA
jgi:hypothetical protein